jgi:ribonucleoside-diphosphate reductase beta chain
MMPRLNGVEHANFFEARATEYSKAATKGNWNEVWDAFDSRKGAKALSEGGATNGVDDRKGGLLGVAAE